MKKILCILLAILIAFMLALAVSAINEDELSSIYVYEEGGNRMELTLTGDTECAIHVVLADGGDISAQASYAWQEENLVVFLNGEKVGAFAVEGEQLILIEDDLPIDKGEGMINDVVALDDSDALPAWQAVLEDVLAYVVLGITAIVGIYTAFSPLLILLKKAANKFTNATAGVLSTATEGAAQSTEVKKLKAEIEKYIKAAADRQAASERELAARAAQAEKMLGTVMQMLTTLCCASPELVKSGVARTVADLKNQFSAAVPTLKDAREESADNGKEA